MAHTLLLASAMLHPRVLLILVASLVAVVACSSTTRVASQPEQTAASEPAEKYEDTIRPLHDHMQEHFVRMDLMQKALISGDLDRVRREANWLLNKPEPAGMPTAWTPYILELMQATADVSKADAPEGMALGVAQIGAACGRCHAAQGLKLDLSWDRPPTETIDPKLRMLRHLWASERLWDALVAQDDRPWQAGANVFTEEALHSEDLTPDERIDPHVQQMADALHDLGKRAEASESTVERVQLFSKVLTTCATCHSDVGKGPPSPPELN